jgi:RNA polymerase sigma-70 factor (ECF subfamily)
MSSSFFPLVQSGPSSRPPASGRRPARTVNAVSDAEICSGLSNREPWAAEALYERVHSVIDLTLRRVLARSGSEVEDLVQTTFERLVRSLTEGRFAQESSLATWASAIAVHVGFDTIRRMTVERRLFERPEAPDLITENVEAPKALDRLLEARSDVELVQALLNKLTPERAEAIVLHDILGHDLREVADIQHVSVAAAQSRLVRGRKQLVEEARRRGAMI